MRSKLNGERSYHAYSGKVNNTQIWSLRKTNAMNSFKVKTWEEFDLVILKANKSTNREVKFLQKIDSSLLDLQHTSSHAYDFEIPLKDFRSPLIDLAATRFH